jgi:hypothetical protein
VISAAFEKSRSLGCNSFYKVDCIPSLKEIESYFWIHHLLVKNIAITNQITLKFLFASTLATLMPELSPTSVSLVRHTASPTSAVRSIKAEISTTSNGALRLRYLLEGELEQLSIPAGAPPVRADELWRHTCFEAFIAASSSPAYCEFNFSPSAQWAAYGFTRYRQEMIPLECGDSLPVGVRRSNGRLELEARITSMALGRLSGSGAIRMALAAIVEEQQGRLSYWALAHPSSSPDFHHPGSFALHLQRPVAGAPPTDAEALS